MKVLLSGATGFIGGHLRPELEAAGHEVLTVGRGANSDFDWSDEGLKCGVGAVDSLRKCRPFCHNPPCSTYVLWIELEK